MAATTKVQSPDDLAAAARLQKFYARYSDTYKYLTEVVAVMVPTPTKLTEIQWKLVLSGYQLAFDPIDTAVAIELHTDILASQAQAKDQRAGEILATPDFFHGNQRRS